MKISYIKHSAFLLETENNQMLFDYFEGELPHLNEAKPLYIFSSHSHGDHFSPCIFGIKHENKIKYILSDDIPRENVPSELIKNTVFIAPDSLKSVDELTVCTLKSTDMGVAFLIKDGEKSFYHAGDLNCWVWEGAPERANRMMQCAYTGEIMKLSDEIIDVAFVPLDPRQEQDFALGMQIFLDNVRVKKVFPMHMWDDLSVTEKFMNISENRKYEDIFVKIGAQPQSFKID